MSEKRPWIWTSVSNCTHTRTHTHTHTHVSLCDSSRRHVLWEQHQSLNALLLRRHPGHLTLVVVLLCLTTHLTLANSCSSLCHSNNSTHSSPCPPTHYLPRYISRSFCTCKSRRSANEFIFTFCFSTSRKSRAFLWESVGLYTRLLPLLTIYSLHTAMFVASRRFDLMSDWTSMS